MKVFYLVFLFIFFEDFVIKNRGIFVNNQKKNNYICQNNKYLVVGHLFEIQTGQRLYEQKCPIQLRIWDAVNYPY